MKFPPFAPRGAYFLGGAGRDTAGILLLSIMDSGNNASLGQLSPIPSIRRPKRRKVGHRSQGATAVQARGGGRNRATSGGRGAEDPQQGAAQSQA